MGERLSSLLERYRAVPEAVRRDLVDPVLVWEDAPAAETPLTGELVWKTAPGFKPKRPGEKDPVVYFLRKTAQKNNAFGLGITLGRTNNNDLAVDDASVSRFHAYFQMDPASAVWHVVDADSSNGTFCAGERLLPGRPAPLTDGVVVGVGDVNLVFLLSSSLSSWVLKKMLGR